MLGNVDAVEGLYYVLMHGWFKIVPPTEFWSRVPSGLAVGAAAAGVVVLGRQFSSRTVALASGVVCAILPRATWAGIEARPYAISMMAAVWLTVLLIRATRRDDAWVWLCLRPRPGDVGIARRVSAAVVSRVRRFHLRLSAQPNRRPTVRACVRSGRLCPDAVFDRGRRPNASDQLGRADRAPDDRGCGNATVFRAKPSVRNSVRAHSRDGYCVVAVHIRAPSGGGSPAIDVGDWLACYTDRT